MGGCRSRHFILRSYGEFASFLSNSLQSRLSVFQIQQWSFRILAANAGESSPGILGVGEYARGVAVAELPAAWPSVLPIFARAAPFFNWLV
jgi:hypothetical protein